MKERLDTVTRAAIGAAGGVWKYYVRPELTAGRAWMAIGAGVLAYEVACPDGQLLSEGVDRALESHRAATLGAIGVTALHLANMLPPSIDPFHQALKLVKGNGNRA